MFWRGTRKLSDPPSGFQTAKLRSFAKILVIDDDPNSFPVKTLKTEGYNVDYWDHVENLSRLESGEFDIIILDIGGVADHLSTQDGLAVLEQLKRSNPAQIIVAFSGQTFDLSKTSFWKLADDTLPKPVDVIKCKQVIDNLLETKISVRGYWNGIVALLQAREVPQRKISKIEDQIASALNDGKIPNGQAVFEHVLRNGQDLITALALVGKIAGLFGH